MIDNYSKERKKNGNRSQRIYIHVNCEIGGVKRLVVTRVENPAARSI
jgi:hypothetical protein